MKKLFLFLFVVVSCNLASAQNADLSSVKATTTLSGYQYPRILPDNRVEFQIKAPNAQKVQLDLGKLYDMNKDANGIWSVITEPQGSGIHYYSMVIDGVSVADPASESFFGCSRMMSCVEVPYEKNITQYNIKNVPHGDVRTVRYFSNVTNSWRIMYVYTPANYDKNISKKYPVLYIIHGGGEDARGWVQQGRTDIILDNLAAEGKAVPMLVVSLDANVGSFENVQKEIMNNIVPFVEKNFRADARADKRALAGLSLGGMYTLYIGIPHTDFFHYLGVFSSGWFAQNNSFMNLSKEREGNYDYMKANVDKINHNLKLFWISQGGKEDIAYQNCQIMNEKIKQFGIKYEYYESVAGGHTWPVWREDLFLFAPRLFK